MAGIIEVKDQGVLRIYDADNSNYIDIVVPSTVSSNRTITLPDASFTIPTSGGSTGIDDNADATAITIDSNENVGIGTSSMDGILHLDDGTTTNLVIEKDGGGSGSIKFHNDGTSTSYIQLDASEDMVYYGGSGVNQIFYAGANERMRIASDGEVAVNDSAINTGAAVLKVKGAQNNDVAIFVHKNTSGSETMFRFRDGDQTTCGTIGIDTGGNSVSYNTSSDYRLKENVNYSFDATTRLKQLKPARFNFISNADKTVDGFLAHEVSSIVPEAIQGEKDAFETYKEHQVRPDDKNIGDFKLDEDGNKIPEYQGIDQSKLVPLLVKTIQELEARITTLENA